MARLVKRYRSRPYAVTIGGETKYICGCGLSSTQPFCNGTHKITQTEAPGTLSWYDQDGQRHDTPDSFPDICSDEQTKDA
ncbi:MAG: CDGSH iron-sulfur domain-containing protein [Betaproteobacteria bacterium]|nr:CDGSH iron-sulfur domain-containing protein [Betaproteobacteria bacterium]MBI2960536.1 CDGSH iron-sulfur domain-containing protein [Betaproteobacteria bacterium]